MEFAQSKGPNSSVYAATLAEVAEAKDDDRRHALDAKETADKVTEEGDETGGLAATVPADVEEIVADMVTSVDVAVLSTPEPLQRQAQSRWPNSVSVLTTILRGRRTAQPERAVPTSPYVSVAFGGDTPLLHVCKSSAGASASTDLSNGDDKYRPLRLREGCGHIIIVQDSEQEEDRGAAARNDQNCREQALSSDHGSDVDGSQPRPSFILRR
ncbi:unnamed protein product [Phytophthora fragariaefolia]|uniref:Unnamed protein product n=1 Tax=Phytophthora fragariaefolia TaxID=1490495 RepID=A0A9W6Y7H6_9STRA|nr:unnamed protein product [Phytophthora fragariaefolia]